MQNDIDAYTKTQVRPKVDVRMNPDFPDTLKALRKTKMGGKKSAGKMEIAELGEESEITI